MMNKRLTLAGAAVTIGLLEMAHIAARAITRPGQAEGPAGS